jgi:hypothetical protein
LEALERSESKKSRKILLCSIVYKISPSFYTASVELTHSARGRATAAICAQPTAGVDVKRSLWTPTLVSGAETRGFGLSCILFTQTFAHPPEEQALMIAGRADTRYRRSRTTKSVDSWQHLEAALHWLSHLGRLAPDQGPSRPASRAFICKPRYLE